RLRGGGAARAERPGPVPRHRARRLVHRRPAQVAVRAVRLLRARVPRPRASAGGAPAGCLLPGSPERHVRVEPERLRASPLPSPARAPAVVLARDLRNGRLPGCGRAGPGGHAGGGRRDPNEAARARAHPGTRVVGGPVPAARMGTRRLRGLVAPSAPGADRFRSADDLGGREGGPPVLRQPPNTDPQRPRDPRRALIAIGAVLLDLYDTLAWTEWPSRSGE